ncbi:NAD(P)-dependent oxidoreductase [Pseudonocardia sp. WMMC193]|uniref:NAD(P)-dependent oxidoreductase n=1 Tax=Pseudonocardia sp. WMMC193 TaxID=2911965 RepID=UPI001F23713E|nr:NAD(P)-dependent oxidoreductase [Pseudonocardia sp. WMMC193]MCF7549942.1 phosphoglycerate dehydrogenase [Pseudonocardia sp. WMMC193]
MPGPSPTVALPDDDLRALAGPFPSGVRTVVWDWREPGPVPTEVTLLVSEHSPRPPAPEVLAALPRLRLVQLPSSGVDPWLPVVPAGVVLCNGRGIHGAATAEAAVAGVLAVLRRHGEAHDARRARRWEPLVVEQLGGRRVTVVGAGDVGGRIATILRAFGAEVAVVGRTPRAGVTTQADLPTLLPATDVLVLAVPLTDATRGLVDAAVLAALPAGAVVANVARGPVVDTDALVAEVARGRLRAYLDVTDPEPLPTDHPLWHLPGVVLTPHTGGGETAWRRRFAELVREQVRRAAAGLPPVNAVPTVPA